MPKVVDGEVYLNTQEAMAELGASRKRFYDNAKPLLRVYRFDAKKTPWYRQSDVQAIKAGKFVRKASIVISGMFGSWTEFARVRYGAVTQLRESGIETTLSEELCERFQVPRHQVFVVRSRITQIDGAPICTWATYYPRKLVDDELLALMKQGRAEHITEQICKTNHVEIGHNRDIYQARMTTLDELNLFRLSNDEPVLVLQRASFSRDNQVLVLLSDMSLLGSWFLHDHEYDL